jgi:hypothetical protein
MKTLGINCQWQSDLFFIVTFHFSVEKSTMLAPRLSKEYLTGIGQVALVLVAAFPIVNKI